jgi:hypothetical protein
VTAQKSEFFELTYSGRLFDARQLVPRIPVLSGWLALKFEQEWLD